MPVPEILSAATAPATTPLIFAVPKGRILAEVLPLMVRAGVVPEAEFHDKGSRALSFACTDRNMRIIRLRDFYVAAIVRQVAELASIVGSDVVEEFDYLIITCGNEDFAERVQAESE